MGRRSPGIGRYCNDQYREKNQIVDSAPFKQNKYTPATHLPIVAPEKLIADKVDAVIVMAAGYSDEVAGIIKRKFNNIQIAVLRDFGLEIFHK